MVRPAGVVIRAAEVADAERVAVLQLDCWDDAYTGLVPQQVLDDGRAHLDARAERWREILAGATPTLVAEADGDLAGFVMAGPPRDDDIDLELELMALYVRAAWWGAGLGHALFAEAVGDRAAYLWVVDGNERALGFYERQGFRLDGTTKEEPEGLHLRMVRAGTT
jgi:GNAT superfamily N-acetyltransferase